MNKKDTKMFNELSRQLCNELKNKDRCMDCPFYQWDTYYHCFDEDKYEFPLSEVEIYEQNNMQKA